MPWTGPGTRDGELEALQERFRVTFEQAAVGMAHGTIDHKVLRVNRKFASMLGYTPEEMVGHPFAEFSSPSESARSRQLIRGLLEQQAEYVTTEKCFTRRDGTPMWASATFSIGRTPEPYIIAVVQDITAQKTAEEALRQSEARFRLLLENSHDITMVVRYDGSITYVSPSIEHILGWRVDELIGTNAFDLLHADDVATIQGTRDALDAEADKAVTVEFRWVAKDATWRWFESEARNMIGVAPIDGFVINARDITERRAYQRRLDQAARVSSLGRLAASMAHEFNNVLMGIQPFTEVIRRKCGEIPQVKKACDTIESSVRRGRTVSQEILRFTRPAEPSLASVNVHQWLETVATEANLVLGSQYAVTIDGDKQLQIAADRSQLTLALTNLIVNARDAMAGGGAIAMRFQSVERGDKPFVDISIADQGHGIPIDVRENIFTPLYTTKRTGTGLGLAVTHQIVTRHGGTISFESEPGAGTTFHLVLPQPVAGSAVIIDEVPSQTTVNV